MKKGNHFIFSYADILVISIVVFALIFGAFTVFALVTFLLRLLFGFIHFRASIRQFVHWTIIIVSLGLAFVSIKFNYNITIPIIFGLLLIDHAL
jgi:hypothetical protein